jgi:hypothetical protein
MAPVTMKAFRKHGHFGGTRTTSLEVKNAPKNVANMDEGVTRIYNPKFEVPSLSAPYIR